MIYRKHIQREYLAAQRRVEFPETTIPKPLHDLLCGLAGLAMLAVTIGLIALQLI